MSTADNMLTAKEEVRELLDQLPDDSSIDDIQHHIFVRQKIRNGLAASDQGRVLSHDEVEKRMSRWLDR